MKIDKLQQKMAFLRKQLTILTNARTLQPIKEINQRRIFDEFKTIGKSRRRKTW